MDLKHSLLRLRLEESNCTTVDAVLSVQLALLPSSRNYVQDNLQTRIEELEHLNEDLVERVRQRQHPTLRQRPKTAPIKSEPFKLDPTGIDYDVDEDEEDGSPEGDRTKPAKFPWTRLFMYIGIALVIASIVAVAVAVSIAQCTFHQCIGTLAKLGSNWRMLG